MAASASTTNWRTSSSSIRGLLSCHQEKQEYRGLGRGLSRRGRPGGGARLCGGGAEHGVVTDDLAGGRARKRGQDGQWPRPLVGGQLVGHRGLGVRERAALGQ